jgi:hypothetical protein
MAKFHLMRLFSPARKNQSVMNANLKVKEKYYPEYVMINRELLHVPQTWIRYLPNLYPINPICPMIHHN